MRTYLVKEIYYTLQGEGAQVGRAAVFCRFARCNLWSGHEEHRATAVCQFCDTDFVGTDGPGGGRFFGAEALAAAVAEAWAAGADARETGADTGADAGATGDGGRRYVVCTGGEPLLQLDAAAVEAFHHQGFEVGVETNGTIAAPPGLDWVCVSPKARAPLVLDHGNELKLVYPQGDAPPGRFEGLAFDHFWLQPMDGPERAANTAAAVAYCLAHPNWRLSLQTHKYIGIA
ncbi:MAG: 7-carboxy-7-deazaguanine synthase [Acidimicrobiales bacterium]